MEERVINAVKTCLGDKRAVNDVTLDSNLQDLGYDSVDTIMLLTELEAEFDINIDENDFAGILTVGDIVEKLKGAGAC